MQTGAWESTCIRRMANKSVQWNVVCGQNRMIIKYLDKHRPYQVSTGWKAQTVSWIIGSNWKMLNEK